MKLEKWIYYAFVILVAICSCIAIGFLFVDIIHFGSMCTSYKHSMNTVEPLFYKNSVGKVVLAMPITDSNHFIILAKEAIIAFFRCMNPMCLVFLFFICANLLLLLVFERKTHYEEYQNYLWFLGFLCLLYVLKFLACAAVFGIAYSGSMRSIGVGLTIIGYVGIIFNLILIAFLVLFIVKAILLVKNLVKANE